MGNGDSALPNANPSCRDLSGLSADLAVPVFCTRTSSDTVDGAGSWGHEGLPGNWTWGFPALCTHRHAWPLVSFAFLAGLRFTSDGLEVMPSLPRARELATATCFSVLWTFHSMLRSYRETLCGHTNASATVAVGAYSYESPLVSIQFDGVTRYSGHYTPVQADISAAPGPTNVTFDFSSVAKRWRVERNGWSGTLDGWSVEFSVVVD